MFGHQKTNPFSSTWALIIGWTTTSFPTSVPKAYLLPIISTRIRSAQTASCTGFPEMSRQHVPSSILKGTYYVHEVKRRSYTSIFSVRRWWPIQIGFGNNIIEKNPVKMFVFSYFYCIHGVKRCRSALFAGRNVFLPMKLLTSKCPFYSPYFMGELW